MKKLWLYYFVVLSLIFAGCTTRRLNQETRINVQEGLLIYYMNEPYFFPVVDTSIERISNLGLLGLKLGRIDMNDVLQEISHKCAVVVYVAGNNNKIDTVNTKVGILPVRMETRPTKTKLSIDTAAFNFEYLPNKWGFFKYEVRYDKEVLSVRPLNSSDAEKLRNRLEKLKPEE